eukprot:scaffold44093_cov31-Tisochrysis_lutea.AAC.5
MQHDALNLLLQPPSRRTVLRLPCDMRALIYARVAKRAELRHLTSLKYFVELLGGRHLNYRVVRRLLDGRLVRASDARKQQTGHCFADVDRRPICGLPPCAWVAQREDAEIDDGRWRRQRNEGKVAPSVKSLLIEELFGDHTNVHDVEFCLVLQKYMQSVDDSDVHMLLWIDDNSHGIQGRSEAAKASPITRLPPHVDVGTLSTAFVATAL